MSYVLFVVIAVLAVAATVSAQVDDTGLGRGQSDYGVLADHSG